MLIPVVGGTISAFYRIDLFTAILTFLLGVAFAVIPFSILVNGMSSTNWGTYFRNTEPIRYWIDVIIWTVAYILVATAGFFVRPH